MFISRRIGFLGGGDDCNMSTMSWRQTLKRKLTIKNETVKQCLAEFLGTYLLIVLGDASVAQFVLGRGQYGGFLSVNWSWGVAVAMGVWVSGGISGGHINPAVTLTMCLMGRTSWRKLGPYWLAQYTGAFFASCCVYAVYSDGLRAFDGGVRHVVGVNGTAGIWATYPQSYLTAHVGFFDQIVSTGILLCLVLTLTDKYNKVAPPAGLLPLCVGLIVFAIGMTYGVNCGYAINPARDWGPRIFTLVAGWGTDTFSLRGYNWFWVPFLGPHVGAIVGAGVYQLCVGIHNQPAPDDTDNELREVTVKNELLKAEA